MEKLLFIPVLALFTLSGCNSTKYQVSRYKNDQAIVLDTTTGEAWVTNEYDDSIIYGKTNLVTYLKPVSYMYNQKDSWKYTPEETRNYKNAGWWVPIRRVFGQGKN